MQSTNGVNIFASEHRNYQTSFSETLGYPDNQLTTKYWFTRYAYNANVKTWLLVANPPLANLISESEGGILHIDELNLRSGLSSSAVAAAVLSLEMQNVVVSLPGKRYSIH